MPRRRLPAVSASRSRVITAPPPPAFPPPASTHVRSVAGQARLLAQRTHCDGIQKTQVGPATKVRPVTIDPPASVAGLRWSGKGVAFVRSTVCNPCPGTCTEPSYEVVP
jgi:hypothetical protein